MLIPPPLGEKKSVSSSRRIFFSLGFLSPPFQVGQASQRHVPTPDADGARVRVLHAGHAGSVGNKLPLPVGPALILSGPRISLVSHGLGAAARCAGE